MHWSLLAQARVRGRSASARLLIVADGANPCDTAHPQPRNPLLSGPDNPGLLGTDCWEGIPPSSTPKPLAPSPTPEPLSPTSKAPQALAPLRLHHTLGTAAEPPGRPSPNPAVPQTSDPRTLSAHRFLDAPVIRTVLFVLCWTQGPMARFPPFLSLPVAECCRLGCSPGPSGGKAVLTYALSRQHHP